MTSANSISTGSDLESRNPQDEEISLFAVGTALIRSWRRLVGWTLAGGLLALALVIGKPNLYSATLTFLPQGGDPGRSGLAALAGQFGIPTPTSSPAQQPEFYLVLLQSRVILAPIVVDTFAVPELGQRRLAFVDLLDIQGSSPENRLEKGVKALQKTITTAVVKNASIVRVTVRTRWPSVSLHASQLLLEAINSYNLRMSQSQASAERKFVEGRLEIAKDSLRFAEDRLQDFLSANRSGVSSSPQLNSASQRLERDVGAKTAIMTGLAQEYENVRIREVRDTPTITVVESPSVSTTPEPRGRTLSVLLGLILGAGFGTALALVSATIARRRSLRDPAADEFFGVLGASKDSLLRRLALRGRSAPRG